MSRVAYGGFASPVATGSVIAEDGSNPNQPRVKMEGFDMPTSSARTISSPSPYATSFPSSYKPSPISSASYGGGGGGGFNPGSSGFRDDLLDMIAFGGNGGGIHSDMGVGSSGGLGLGSGSGIGLDDMRGSREATVAMEDVSGGQLGSGGLGSGQGAERSSFSGDFANLGFSMDHSQGSTPQNQQHQQQVQHHHHQQQQQQQQAMFQYKPVQGNPYDFFASPSVEDGSGGGADPHAILGGGGGGGEMDLDLSAFGGGGTFFDDPVAQGLGHGQGHAHPHAHGQFGAPSSAPAGLYNTGSGGGNQVGTNSTHPFETNGTGGGFRFNPSPSGTTLGQQGFSLNAPSHLQQLQQLRLMQIQQAGMPFRRNMMTGNGSGANVSGGGAGGNVKSDHGSSSLDGMTIGNFASQYQAHQGLQGGAFTGGAFGHSLPVGGSPFSSHDTSTVGSSMTLSQGGLSFNSVLADLINGGNGQNHLQGGQQHPQQAITNLGGGNNIQPSPSMCLREYQALLRGSGVSTSEAMSILSSTQVSTPSSTEDTPQQQQQQQHQAQANTSSYRSAMGAPATPNVNASSSLPLHQRSGSIARRSASRARGEKQVAASAAGKRAPRTSFSGTDTVRPNMQHGRHGSTTSVNATLDVPNNGSAQRESSVGPQRRKPLKRGTSYNNADGSPKVNFTGGIFPGASSGSPDTAVSAARAALNNASTGIMSPQSLQRFLGQVVAEGTNPTSRSSHSTGPNTSQESPSSHTTPSTGDVDEGMGTNTTPAPQSQAGGSRAPPSAIPLRVVKTERSYSLDSVGSMRPSFRRVGSELVDGNMETVDEDAVEDEDADDKPIRPLTSEEIALARKSRRRLSHNEVERKRRETINEKIVELEQLLPPLIVASALAATQTETIKEEEEDGEEEIQVIGKGGKKGTSKTRGRKIVKKQVIPDRLCKGTVLCLTVDLIKQMQDIIQVKDAREQELLSQIHSMQAQLGQGSDGNNQFFDHSHFNSDGFGQGNELTSIGDYGAGFGLMDVEDRPSGSTADDRGRTRGR